MFKLVEWDPKSQTYTGVRDKYGFPVCSFSIHDMIAEKAIKPHAWIYDCEAEDFVEEDQVPDSGIRKRSA